MKITMSFWISLSIALLLRVIPYIVTSAYYLIFGVTFSDGAGCAGFFAVALWGFIRTYRDFFKVIIYQ